MSVCIGCDKSPGVHSLQVYRRDFVRLSMPPELRAQNREQQEQATVMAKADNYTWGLLQGLMERE